MALLLALSCLRYSNAQTSALQLDPTQVYTTPNLVAPTVAGSGTTPWTNSVYQDSLTCFAWGNPGYCGPNPIATPGYNLNYSWGWVDTYQQQTMANALPFSGTGLRVNGYVFSFEAKNGNGWDDGRTDLLFAYVQFNSPKGTALVNHTHNLSTQFNWTQFNYNQTFATPYLSGDIGTVRYGFVGQDNNGWAGPYGPEIRSISFGLKYSVDPCVINALSSPSCPGFAAALAAKTATPAPAEQPAAVVATTAPAAISAAPAPATVTAAPVATASPVQPPATATRESGARSNQASPRVENIVKSVNEATAATVAITVQTSQEQARSIEQAINQNTENQSQQSQQMTAATVTAPTATTAQPVAQRSFTSVEISADAAAGAFTRPGDPAAAARMPLPVMETETPVEARPQPRSTQPPAELAGGPSVVAFQAGVDITAYTNLALRDSQFYAPREIYRGQQTVDNRQALRGLGTDRLHQDMVNQQWRR